MSETPPPRKDETMADEWDLTPCILTVDHCQLCGEVNPTEDDGYTACCNEPVEPDNLTCDGHHPSVDQAALLAAAF